MNPAADPPVTWGGRRSWRGRCTGRSGWWRSRWAPELTARGDPAHDHVVAGIVARLIGLPRRATALAKDETHLNLLPHVRGQLDAARCPAADSQRPGDRSDLRQRQHPSRPQGHRLPWPRSSSAPPRSVRRDCLQPGAPEATRMKPGLAKRLHARPAEAALAGQLTTQPACNRADWTVARLTRLGVGQAPRRCGDG